MPTPASSKSSSVIIMVTKRFTSKTTKFQNSFSFQKIHFLIRSLGTASGCLHQTSCVLVIVFIRIKKSFPSGRDVTERKVKTTFKALPPLLIAFTITVLVLLRPSCSCLWGNNVSGSFFGRVFSYETLFTRGMRHTSVALFFYGASKKNVHKPTSHSWINLLYRKYVFNNYLHIFYLRFLSWIYLNV